MEEISKLYLPPQKKKNLAKQMAINHFKELGIEVKTAKVKMPFSFMFYDGLVEYGVAVLLGKYPPISSLRMMLSFEEGIIPCLFLINDKMDKFLFMSATELRRIHNGKT